MGRQPVEIQAILSGRLKLAYRPVLVTGPGTSQTVDDVTVWQRRDLPRAGNR
jgi:hypothetical protein